MLQRVQTTFRVARNMAEGATRLGVIEDGCTSLSTERHERRSHRGVNRGISRSGCAGMSAGTKELVKS